MWPPRICSSPLSQSLLRAFVLPCNCIGKRKPLTKNTNHSENNMNEIAKVIGESLQGMKGPEVMLVIASVLAMPVFLYILVMAAVNEVKKRRNK